MNTTLSINALLRSKGRTPPKFCCDSTYTLSGGSAQELNQTGDSKMPHQNMASCIKACYECAEACNHCAASCLQEDDVKMMARCIALDVDCAEVCQLAAAAMSRASESSKLICNVCAEICEKCGQECAKHKMEHCQQCAQACMRCAAECRKMAAMA